MVILFASIVNILHSSGGKKKWNTFYNVLFFHGNIGHIIISYG